MLITLNSNQINKKNILYSEKTKNNILNNESISILIKLNVLWIEKVIMNP